MSLSGGAVTLGPGPRALRDRVAHVIALGGWRVEQTARVHVRCGPGAPPPGTEVTVSVAQRPGPHVDLVIPGDEEALLTVLDHHLSARPCPVVEVVGLSGGAGTSTLAAALAWQLARTGESALVDANPAATDLAGLLGLDASALVTGLSEGAPLAAVAPLPTWGRVRVLAPDRPLTASEAGDVVASVRRDSRWVVVDAGRMPVLEAPSVRVAVAGAPALSAWHAAHVSAAQVSIIVATRRGVPVAYPGATLVRIRGWSGPRRAVERGFGPRPVGVSFRRGLAAVERRVRACLR